MLIGNFAGEAEVDGLQAVVHKGDRSLEAKLTGDTQGLQLIYKDDNLHVQIPAGKPARRFQVTYFVGDRKLEKALLDAELTAESVDFGTFKQGGPQRWMETFTTAGKLGDQAGAYALDDLPVPVRPYGSWMRLSAIDFFADGRAAVATMPGDVWIVSWQGDDISKVTWQRYATGLYEPAGTEDRGG